MGPSRAAGGGGPMGWVLPHRSLLDVELGAGRPAGGTGHTGKGPVGRTSRRHPGGDPSTVATSYWHVRDDGRVQCDVCPRACKLHEGQRGLCSVRSRQGDEIVLTTYGRSTGLCVDPIEKKPLAHFLPGSAVLSFGTAGCNLACRFCQNWETSRARAVESTCDEASPEGIAAAAVDLGCRSVAFTYNDPVVFLEYAADVADACHDRGVRTVAVSAGYVCPEPRAELFGRVDAANIDLKGFSEAFYHRLTGAHLAPVLETIEALHASGTWLELTTLLIPGANDSDREIEELAGWIVDHLGPDVPLHLTAFHPDFKMRDVPPTPPGTLTRARELALAAGVRHAYVGNVHDPSGSATRCPGCGEVVIARDGYEILRYRLAGDGLCEACGTQLPGVFDGPAGGWGERRAPVRLSSRR